jgi:hypothetical protein
MPVAAAVAVVVAAVLAAALAAVGDVAAAVSGLSFYTWQHTRPVSPPKLRQYQPSAADTKYGRGRCFASPGAPLPSPLKGARASAPLPQLRGLPPLPPTQGCSAYY